MTAGSCVAQADLYVAEYQYQAARMISIQPDGSNPTVLFELPPDQWLPLGISFDAVAGRMYWMDSAGPSEMMSANLDGSKSAIVANVPGFARGASRDAQGRLFFSSDNTVQRVDSDGSNLTVIYTSKSPDPVGTCKVDTTNGHVYVGSFGEIVRMDLDGGNVKTVVRGIGQPRAVGLDIASGYIYWLDADLNSDYVGRARLDGSDFTVLIDNTPNVVSGSNSMIDLLVDPVGGKLYYADEIPAVIFSANLDGSDLQLIYTSPSGKAPSGFSLSTGDPVQPMLDCNGNGIADDIDIANGAADCDNNGYLDSCQSNPCPERTLLLDQMSDASNSMGRALGAPSSWQIFQPFDVPPEGWTVSEIGVDGYTANYIDGSGITVRLFPDDGTGNRPDESQELGVTPAFNLLFNVNRENWVYAPMAVTLDQGRYWVRIEANDPTMYSGSINQGMLGLPSLSRGVSGNFTSPAATIALRLVQGEACTADFNDDTVVNSQDFFDFLTAFFGNQPSSDFNDDGVINSQDFFDFLTAFFAGC